MKINNQIENIYHLQSEYLKIKKVNKKQELICSLQDIKNKFDNFENEYYLTKGRLFDVYG